MKTQPVRPEVVYHPPFPERYINHHVRLSRRTKTPPGDLDPEEIMVIAEWGKPTIFAVYKIDHDYRWNTIL